MQHIGFWCVVCESEGPGVRPGVAGSGRAVRSKHQTCSSPCSSAWWLLSLSWSVIIVTIIMIIILNGYQVINRPADRQQNDDGDITIIIQCTMKLSSVLWNGRDHACVIGGVGGHMMILQSTWTGWRWRCTIFVAQMGVAGRAGRALQPSDSFLTLIVSNIFQWSSSWLLHTYIHIYTFIPTVYTYIYNTYNIPTIYTNIYNYIQIYM